MTSLHRKCKESKMMFTNITKFTWKIQILLFTYDSCKVFLGLMFYCVQVKFLLSFSVLWQYSYSIYHFLVCWHGPLLLGLESDVSGNGYVSKWMYPFLLPPGHISRTPNHSRTLNDWSFLLHKFGIWKLEFGISLITNKIMSKYQLKSFLV